MLHTEKARWYNKFGDLTHGESFAQQYCSLILWLKEVYEPLQFLPHFLMPDACTCYASRPDSSFCSELKGELMSK